MIKAKKCLNSVSGFTLIEMMIVAGILSVLMLGFSGYMFYQSRMNKLQESKQNFNYIESSVLNSASDEEALIRSEKLIRN